MAELYYRYGSMASGKSTEILQVAFNYEKNNLKTLLVKPSKDSKGEEYVVSRLGIKRKVDLLLGENDRIQDLVNLDDIVCILVEEAQFLSTNNAWELFEISKKLDIPVMCWGLKNDFKGELFEGNTQLFALADSLSELTTVCSCGKKARFNARKENGEYVLNGPQVVVDDGKSNATYEPMCGDCFYKKVVEKNKEREKGWQRIKKKI